MCIIFTSCPKSVGVKNELLSSAEEITGFADILAHDASKTKTIQSDNIVLDMCFCLSRVQLKLASFAYLFVRLFYCNYSELKTPTPSETDTTPSLIMEVAAVTFCPRLLCYLLRFLFFLFLGSNEDGKLQCTHRIVNVMKITRTFKKSKSRCTRESECLLIAA